MTPRIQTCLWFDSEGEEAATLYTSLVSNSRIVSVSRYPPNTPPHDPRPEGSAMLVTFELDGARFWALNGGPVFKHSEAVSIVVTCDTQAEIDRLWSGLTANGGAESMCGWLKDRWGVNWQIVPTQMDRWHDGSDPAATNRMMQKLMTMQKLDIAQLEAAYRGD
jgi:predicted 3-demethylubiquinone-9 3-methyltransferase (glyoxalase superfamily)